MARPSRYAYDGSLRQWHQQFPGSVRWRLATDGRGPAGPSGWGGLAVRHWRCVACGATHDRDVNAAINTLIAGAGAALEREAA